MNRREGDSVDDRRVHDRVTRLEEFWKQHSSEHTQLMALVVASAKGVEDAGKEVAKSMADIAEWLKIYNHGRGAYEITRSLGKFVIFVSAVIVALSAGVAAIKYWMLS